MAFCGQCGVKNDDNNRFCASCGAPIRVKTDLEKTDNVQQTQTATIQSVAQSTRKDVYEGVIHKCPNCGSTIKGMEIKCSACGHEFRTQNVTSTVQALSQRLDQLEAQRKDPSKASAIMKSFGIGSHDKITVAKANAISTFPIPTTKEDILEFMIMASANVNGNVIGGTWNGQERAANEELKVEQGAWYSKMEQAYNKAKLSFGSDPVFEEVERIYTQKKKEVNHAKMKFVGMIAGLLILPFAMMFGLMFWVSSDSKSDKNEEKAEIERLEQIVDDIEEDIDDGDYASALRRAQRLHYEGPNSYRHEEEWDEIREGYIEQIERLEDAS